MASFVPPLLDPRNPDAVSRWARMVADTINGQLSIGEPISNDTALLPNGVKGHMLGSFFSLYLEDLKYDLDTAHVCTHNLNVPNKGVGTGPTDLNVGWIIVRAEHSGNSADINSTVSCNYETGDPVTANSIALRFYANAARAVTVADPLYITLWFFPTTR